MAHPFSGTLGVDSVVTNVFIASGSGISAVLRVCCPTANFLPLNDPLKKYYFFTTKKSDGTALTTRWAFNYRDDGTGKNILIYVPLKISANGLYALNAGAFFSPTAGGQYETYHYLGGLAADPNQGIYANPVDFNQIAGAGTVTITAGAVVGAGTTFTAAMVGKTLYTPGCSYPFGMKITAFTDATHMTTGDIWGSAPGTLYTNGAPETWAVGGPLDYSAIAGLTGGNSVGPDDFVTGFQNPWYIDVEPDSVGGDPTGGDPPGTVTADAIASAPFAHNIGKSDGVPVALTNRVSTVTTFAGSTITPAASGYTSGALVGLPMLLIRAADFSMQQAIVTGNTTTTFNFSPAMSGAAPTAGDIVVLGGIVWKVLTARLDAGLPMKKKTFKELTLRVRDKTTSFQQQVYVLAWVNGRFVRGEPGAVVDRIALTRDGCVFKANVARAKVVNDDISGLVRYIIPLDVDGRDIQFLLFGIEADNPVELMAPMELRWTALDEVAPGAR